MHLRIKSDEPRPGDKTDRPRRDSRPIALFRLAELRRLVTFWRETGVPDTVELGERIFRVALPCLVALPYAPNRHGEPGPGDIAAFAMRWCAAYYESKGRSPYFEAMTFDYATGRSPKPRRITADQAAAILDLTADVRKALKIRTIGAVDRK